MEFESFCIYPQTTGDSYRVDAALIDLSSGDRTVLRGVPMRRAGDAGTLRIVRESPWDAMPQEEREFFETRLAMASKEAGNPPLEPDRPELILSLPRVRYVVPVVGPPRRDRVIEDVSPPFLPPFEPNWERALDGDVAEPPDIPIPIDAVNGDVVQMVTSLGSGFKVLDVGCSAGLTGAAVKQLDPEVEWVGVDNVPAAVDIAQRRLDAAHLADIERHSLPYAPGYFDVAVVSQVLEHLYNPWTAARKVVTYLREGGVLLCGVPHAGHVALLTQLLEGRYPYSGSGPLDISHLRLFTAETILQLIEQAGCQPAVLTKLLFRGTSCDEHMMTGLLDASRCAGIDSDGYATDGWAGSFTVVARKQHVTVARRSSLVRRAEKLSETGDYIEAQRLLVLETTLHSQNALGFVRLAHVLKTQGNIEEGINVLDRCVQLHESYLPARYELILALNEAGRSDQALAALEDAAGLNASFFMPLQSLLL